ncbi:MAG TPA: MFS transporter [Mycobacteriales bacterium]|jgi:hypothetical protein|nr:MFS transporter [Mycobacteriales bacterium]
MPDSVRWQRLMPIAFVTYSFAYLDRSNYSLGSAGGLTSSLHISSTQSGLLGGLFFIGYFLFQVPAGAFAERRSVTELMFWSLIAWGASPPRSGVEGADRVDLAELEAQRDRELYALGAVRVDERIHHPGSRVPYPIGEPLPVVGDGQHADGRQPVVMRR